MKRSARKVLPSTVNVAWRMTPRQLAVGDRGRHARAML
jgi:hypothetical protein